MKKAFYGSLCYQGIRGGAIIINNGAVIYKNQTLTLPDEYKNIVLPIKEIADVEKGWLLCLPTITIHLKSKKKYKFVIFNRKGFLNQLEKLR